MDRRKRRQRSQSVSSTSRERHKDVTTSPDKFPRHTHPRRPSSRLHQLPPPPPMPLQGILTTEFQPSPSASNSESKKRAKLDIAAKQPLRLDLGASNTLPPPQQFESSPKHTCGLIPSPSKQGQQEQLQRDRLELLGPLATQLPQLLIRSESPSALLSSLPTATNNTLKAVLSPPIQPRLAPPPQPPAHHHRTLTSDLAELEHLAQEELTTTASTTTTATKRPHSRLMQDSSRSKSRALMDEHEQKLQERLQYERHLHEKHEQERAKLEKERLHQERDRSKRRDVSREKKPSLHYYHVHTNVENNEQPHRSRSRQQDRREQHESRKKQHEIMEREMERRIHEKMEQEAKDQERRAARMAEKKRREVEKAQLLKMEQERLERERKEREKQREVAERRERERLEREQLEQERLELERLERERAERDRREQERLEQERRELERIERERLELERLEALERQRIEEERRIEQERREQERLEQERLEQERLEQERLQQERIEFEKRERERMEREQQKRLEQERLERLEHDKRMEERQRRKREKKDSIKHAEWDVKDRKRSKERRWSSSKNDNAMIEDAAKKQDLLERERLALEMAQKERFAKEMAEQERKAMEGRRSSKRGEGRRLSHEARGSHLVGSYVNGESAIDSVDLLGLASRMSNQSDMRLSWGKHAKSSKKKSYDEALSSLAATLPLVSSSVREKVEPRAVSTAPRGRRGSRTVTPSGGKGIKARSRSNDQEATRYHHGHVYGHQTSVQWRESSLDARLPSIKRHLSQQPRPESPFKSKSKKQHQSSRPASPPCTCDEDTVMGDGRRTPASVVLQQQIASPIDQLAVAAWEDQRSRDSKMSRATTTRTAASPFGFSSLASSAFQMPDNVFADHRAGPPRNLASDTISLEALSPRPRSRSRSRLKNGGLHHDHRRRSSGSRLLADQEPDYHYHHELDRCRSFLEGSLEQHMEFCKCTCNNRPAVYDEYLESKVSSVARLFAQSINNELPKGARMFYFFNSMCHSSSAFLEQCKSMMIYRSANIGKNNDIAFVRA